MFQIKEWQCKAPRLCISSVYAIFYQLATLQHALAPFKQLLSVRHIIKLKAVLFGSAIIKHLSSMEIRGCQRAAIASYAMINSRVQYALSLLSICNACFVIVASLHANACFTISRSPCVSGATSPSHLCGPTLHLVSLLACPNS